VLEVVGTNVEDGQSVLVLWWLFGLLMRENRCWRTRRVGFVATFRLVDAGKSVLEVVGANVEDGQSVLVLWWLFGLLMRESRG